MKNQIEKFVAVLNENFGEQYNYTIEMGRVNARVVMAPVYGGRVINDQRCVYCFVRIKDGAILKAAGWKAPAKGVRGYVEYVLAGAQQPEATTGWLYR